MTANRFNKSWDDAKPGDIITMKGTGGDLDSSGIFLRIEDNRVILGRPQQVAMNEDLPLSPHEQVRVHKYTTGEASPLYEAEYIIDNNEQISISTPSEKEARWFEQYNNYRKKAAQEITESLPKKSPTPERPVKEGVEEAAEGTKAAKKTTATAKEAAEGTKAAEKTTATAKEVTEGVPKPVIKGAAKGTDNIASHLKRKGGYLVAAALIGATIWGVSASANKSKERKRRANHGADLSNQASQMHRYL